MTVHQKVTSLMQQIRHGLDTETALFEAIGFGYHTQGAGMDTITKQELKAMLSEARERLIDWLRIELRNHNSPNSSKVYHYGRHTAFGDAITEMRRCFPEFWDEACEYCGSTLLGAECLHNGCPSKGDD